MAEFSVRSDSVNVEQIMEQIRGRIREKRGVDYTEEQIRELAAVKLQKFLDPRGVRSDLLEQFRKTQPPYAPPELPNYAFEDQTLFESHRGGLRFIRKLLNPILKLFFNPNPLIQALHIQSRINTTLAEREARLEASRRSTESLYYELIHNLVVETTRLGIEVKNLSMRIESMSSRLEFNERRARALESAVVYKPGPGDIVVGVPSPQPAASEPRPSPPSPQQQPRPQAQPRPQPQPQQFQQRPQQQGQPQGQPEGAPAGEGPGQRSRRRRRRRGRRGGGSAAATMQGVQSSPAADLSPAGESFGPAIGSTDHAAEASTVQPAGAPGAAPDPTPSAEPSPIPSSSSEPDAQ
jgi:hypothetical protein